MEKLRRTAPWTAALVLMSGLVVALPLMSGRTVVDSPLALDISYQWIPFASFVQSCYQAGHLPLWDPHDLCGMPFLAFSHTGSLYAPWTAFILAVGKYVPAAEMDIFFHLCLAALSAFALFRAAGRSNVTAFCAAAAYAFSGFIFSNISTPPTLHTGAFLALWYAGCLRLLDRPRSGWFVVSALAVSGMAYGGDLELLIYGVMGMGYEILLRRMEGTLKPGSLAVLVAATAAGALLAMPQAFPSMELGALSIRSGESFLPSLNLGPFMAMPLFALFQIPRPMAQFPPNNGLDPFYLGALFVLFAAAGLLQDSHARKRLCVFPLFAIYAAIIYLPPLNRIGSHIPVLGQLMVPYRAWPVLHLFFLLAATRAMDRWIHRSEGAEAPKPDATVDRPQPESLFPLGRLGAAFCIAFAVATALSLFRIDHHPGIFSRLVFCAALAGAGIIGLTLRRRTPVLAAGLRGTLVAALVLLDLYALALAWLPRTGRDRFQPDPRLAPVLAGTTGRERYMILSSRGVIDPGLPFHLGLRLSADTIDAYTRVPPRNSAHRLGMLFPNLFRYREGRLIRYDQMSVRNPDNLDPERIGLLNLMNVTWLISRYPARVPPDALDLEGYLQEPGMYIYRNNGALPRAYVQSVGGIVPLEVYPLAPDRLEVSGGPLRDGGAPEELEVVVSDSWAPGWRAFKNGSEAGIREDRLAFMRVTVSAPGKITMSYEPASFRLGLWTGLASLLCLGAALVWRRD